METNFFAYPSFREYLAARYAHQKAVVRNFSARYLAKRAGIRSPSHFGLVVTGRRRLSLRVAKQFATGLDLDEFSSECLLASAGLETCKDSKARRHWAEKLKMLRKQATGVPIMNSDHVRILADLVNLKLYLLAQCKGFSLSHAWLVRQLPAGETEQTLSRRIETLLSSGLWRQEGKRITTIAPTIQTGDGLAEGHLRETHETLLAAAKQAIFDSPDRRVFSGQTFLFDPKNTPLVAKRIERFKSELEAEFEDLASTRAYQVQIGFFELGSSK